MGGWQTGDRGGTMGVALTLVVQDKQACNRGVRIKQVRGWVGERERVVVVVRRRKKCSVWLTHTHKEREW